MCNSYLPFPPAFCIEMLLVHVYLSHIFVEATQTNPAGSAHIWNTFFPLLSSLSSRGVQVRSRSITLLSRSARLLRIAS